MGANLKFKPSGSQDVVNYNLYYKPDEPNIDLNKNNSVEVIDIGKPVPDADGFCHIQLDTLPELAGLDGMYDLGVASVDDAGNVSPLLTTGLMDVSLDFLAPSPPSEASIYWD